MASNTSVEVKIDQSRWVISIRDGLAVNHEKEEGKEICIAVFNVPKELLAVKPDAYVPQSVSIGPYHQWRSELYEMERYKVAAARRFQQRVEGLKFESVVEELKKHEWQIRSCYHKYLDYTEEALAWLMALDASFVLECLQFYVKQADQGSKEVISEVKQLGKVLDPSGRSATHNAIMRDLMMLENQVPLFIMQKLLEMQLGSEEKAEEGLCNLVAVACEALSPFTFKMPESSRLRIKERGHVLEVLYYAIVPAAAIDRSNTPDDEIEKEPLPDATFVKKSLTSAWVVFSRLNIGPVRRLTALPRPGLSSTHEPLTICGFVWVQLVLANSLGPLLCIGLLLLASGDWAYTKPEIFNALCVPVKPFGLWVAEISNNVIHGTIS